jgi:ferredoxin-thioredoxin reductase catalytic subunit
MLQIKVSDDKEHVAMIRAKLKENGGYCPCELVKSPETKCMCKEFLESTESGPCHCGLYVKTIN